METLTQENQRLKDRLAVIRKAKSAESHSTVDSTQDWSASVVTEPTQDKDPPICKSCSPPISKPALISSGFCSSKPHLHPNCYSDNISRNWDDNISGSYSAEPVPKDVHSVHSEAHDINSMSSKAKGSSKLGAHGMNPLTDLDDFSHCSFSTSRFDEAALEVMAQTIRVVLEDKQGELNPSNCYRVMYKYAQAQVELRKKTTELKLVNMRLAKLQREAEEREDTIRREAAEREVELDGANTRIANLLKEAEEREATIQREAAEREAVQREAEIRRVTSEREAKKTSGNQAVNSLSILTAVPFETANIFSENTTSGTDKIEEDAATERCGAKGGGVEDGCGGSGKENIVGFWDKEVVEDDGSCVSSLSCGVESDNALPQGTGTSVPHDPDTRKNNKQIAVSSNGHNSKYSDGIVVDPFAELITACAWGVAFTFCIIYQLYLSKPVAKAVIKLQTKNRSSVRYR